MKFSIRDLLLVTVIVALLLGWGLDHWRLSRSNQFLRALLDAYGIKPISDHFP